MGGMTQHSIDPLPLPCRRLDVGGKLLTGHLKELLSYRQYNVMDDTALVNTVRRRRRQCRKWDRLKGGGANQLYEHIGVRLCAK